MNPAPIHNLDRRQAENILNINNNFITALLQILGEIQKHKHNCNVSKSKATGISVIGSGLVVSGTIIASGGTALALTSVLALSGFGAGIVACILKASTGIQGFIVSEKFLNKIAGLHKELMFQLQGAPEFIHMIIQDFGEIETSFWGTALQAGLDI